MVAIIHSLRLSPLALTLSLALVACAGTSSDAELVSTTDDALKQQWHSEADVANDKAYAQVLSSFAKNTVRGSFVSDIPKNHGAGSKVEIAYAIARAVDEKGAIVVLNGRTETFDQYAELAWDMNRRGYTLYMLDHRGQGHSTRLLDYDRVGDGAYQKGHVDEFDDYVDDLHQFITTVVRPDRAGNPHRELLGLGHSMGGTVLTLYAMKHQSVLTRIALTSPMHEVEAPQHGLAGLLLDLAIRFNSTDYAKGKGPRDPDEAFAGNPLTSSRPRFNAKQAVWDADRTVLVGGPTYGWVGSAINGTARAREHADRIQIPVLLVRPEDDRVVEPEGQKQVCDKINSGRKGTCRLKILKGSQHEPLIEVDAIRRLTLNTILDFYEE